MTIPGVALIGAAPSSKASSSEATPPQHTKAPTNSQHASGYKIYTDYRDDQLGKKRRLHPSRRALYCPSMPDGLVDASCAT